MKDLVSNDKCVVVNTTEDSESRFPCIEQPTRVALHCNGYYLWCKSNGKVTGSKKKSDKNEFLLIYDNDGTLCIRHHKYQGTLSVVEKNGENGMVKNSVVCVKPSHDTKLLDKEDTNSEDEDEDGESDSVETLNEVNEENKKWCFIKSADDNYVMLKSLSTGLGLGMRDDGKLFWCNDKSNSRTILWTIECVTGELCFLSNAKLNERVRCDLAGLLNLSENWKGWEVFRFMETSHGYVKISSWMHDQWFLCSTKDGTVSTCSHAESLKHNLTETEGDTQNTYKCSKWAIEKSPSGGGVVIRSKTYGRFLSVRNNGELRTYDDSNDGNLLNCQSDETKVTKDTFWSKNFTSSLKSGLEDARKSVQTMQTNLKKKDNSEAPAIPEKDTLVWQLEAAHSQNYFFFSLNLDVEGSKAKSIGPFPKVTTNLRKTTIIKLIREDDNVSKLCINNTKKQFVACTADGAVILVDSIEDKNTEWIMDKSQYQEGGTFFKSRAHNRYLSYRKVETKLGESKEASATDKLNSLFQKDKGDQMEELYGSETIGVEETWKLDPCMPRAVSSDKIKSFAIGTSIAVGTTVAMPFALAGVGALLGAIGAEVGTLATVVFAGLTGAEAIASVGAIGATAYIVFKPAENSLTDDQRASNDAEEERAWSKRPLSNWRKW